MTRLRPRHLALALLAPALLLVSAEGAGANGSHGRDPKDPRSRPGHEVTWTNTAPPITLAAPFCDANGQCLYPWTEAGTTEGDFTGSYIASGTATANATGDLAVVRLDTYTGTLARCGTGTFVIRSVEHLGPNPQPTEWEIEAGFGTGDLATVHGDGEGTGAQLPDGTLTATLTGKVSCGR